MRMVLILLLLVGGCNQYGIEEFEAWISDEQVKYQHRNEHQTEGTDANDLDVDHGAVVLRDGRV